MFIDLVVTTLAVGFVALLAFAHVLLFQALFVRRSD